MFTTQVVLGIRGPGSYGRLEHSQQTQDLMDTNPHALRVCVCVCVCVVPIIALGQCCLTVRSQPLESGYLGLQPHSTITKPINSPGFSFLVCKVEW